MKQKIISSILLIFVVGIFASCNTNINGEVTKKDYTVIFNAEGEGTITATIDGNEISSGEAIKKGTIIEFKAFFDNQKYEVYKWLEATENMFDKTRAKLIVSEDVEVKVIIMDIKPIEVTLNFVSDPNGKIEARIGDQELHSGDKLIKDSVVSFKAIPNDGYEVSLWSGATANDEDKNSATAIAKTDLNVSVIFKKISEDGVDMTKGQKSLL